LIKKLYSVVALVETFNNLHCRCAWFFHRHTAVLQRGYGHLGRQATEEFHAQRTGDV